jgi:hypothetical protein
VDTAHDGADSVSGTGGATTTTSGTGGETSDGGEMCNAPPPPSPTLPNQLGCYVDMGAGWIPTPCVCDLWLANTTFLPINAGIDLVVTPADQVPSLDGPLVVDVEFDDPDASFYATWAKQTGNGTAFTIKNDKGKTTVTMGSGKLTLLPVPVTACETRKAIAHIAGSNWTAKLDIHATLENQIVSATTDSNCSNPPPP